MHLDLRKNDKSAPNNPETMLRTVNTNVSCFSRKSGSGHALRSHSIGQMIMFFFGIKYNFFKVMEKYDVGDVAYR